MPSMKFLIVIQFVVELEFGRALALIEIVLLTTVGRFIRLSG